MHQDDRALLIRGKTVGDGVGAGAPNTRRLPPSGYPTLGNQNAVSEDLEGPVALDKRHRVFVLQRGIVQGKTIGPKAR
jgi:hypothetical protein